MKLRPMVMADADKMLKWKNYPETRKFAIASHEKIKREDHIKWLGNNFQYFQMITIQDNAIGTSEFDVGAVRIQGNEISIWIDRIFRGHGLTAKAIEAVSKKGMTAKIVAGNVASMRCFIKCGYLPILYQDGYFIFQL